MRLNYGDSNDSVLWILKWWRTDSRMLNNYISIMALLSSFVSSSFAVEPGSVIFIHADGTGLGHWNAGRFLHAGPDGDLNWDRMDHLAAYRVHQKNWLSATSHAGATTHAYGVKVHYDSFGLDRTAPITSASGSKMTILEEAAAAGYRTGIVNSGHIGEPGTAVFLSRSESRRDVQGIATQVLESGVNVIFCAGEVYLIPDSETGVHGKLGKRTDGRNLLKEAESRGYTVIFTREELLGLDSSVDKVIGIFAAEDTYNDEEESVLAERGLLPYDPKAPSFDEMVRVALRILGRDPDRHFCLVAEEEGTDNFSNATNAAGMLEAIGRADRAIGETFTFMEAYPEQRTLLIVGADSDAGHPAIFVPRDAGPDYQLPEESGSGAQVDGINGTGGQPFMALPDAYGNRYPFGIAWATSGDYQGSDVARAHGYRSELMGTNIDNTDLYKIFYKVLFGQE